MSLVGLKAMRIPRNTVTRDGRTLSTHNSVESLHAMNSLTSKNSGSLEVTYRFDSTPLDSLQAGGIPFIPTIPAKKVVSPQ